MRRLTLDDLTHVKRHIAYDRRPDYLCEIDEWRCPNGLPFLQCHIKFTNFTPRLYKEFLNEWRIFRTKIKYPLFCYNLEDGTGKWIKFVSRLGFKPINVMAPINEKNELRQMFVCMD